MTQKTSGPASPLTIKEVKVTKNHPLAIYYEIVFVDANGKMWKAAHAHLLSVLNEVVLEQND
jgi:hypothetical protein